MKAENDAPICPDCDCIKAFKVALKQVQPKPWKIHIARLAGAAKDKKDVLDFFNVVLTNTFDLTVLKQPFSPLCVKEPDHASLS